MYTLKLITKRHILCKLGVFILHAWKVRLMRKMDQMD